MGLHELRPAPGARTKRKRLGKGMASGSGKTSGKGHKGQKSRSGRKVRPGFEGGQMPLIRRVPKRGFSNARFAKVYQVVNVGEIANRFQPGAVVGFEEMYEARLVRKTRLPVKILADGEIGGAFTIKADAFSAEARAKIEAAGGKVEVV
ncbi:MAG: 50S ribosomal protein L15 [Synergistaceae bacterium]|nr:50S ribosomal protein L15 [Synergistota bacterium]NLM71939.1 50S ribosomal protein L15 [Synergistaceae bacterium]